MTSASMPRTVIIGAGPAGIRAAQLLARHGGRPVLIDEADRGGGQIYRQPPPARQRPYPALYGFEHAKASRLHATLRELASAIEYRPGTLAWDLRGNTVFTLADGVPGEVTFDRLILATGATDRIIPFPGWLTPGVYTLGAAQVSLKAQAAVIGSPVVFLGTGPLLYLVAYQYARAGARVAAVLDSSPAQAWRTVRGLAAAPGLLAKGAYYVGWLRAHGVRIEHAVVPVRVEGRDTVQAVVWRRADAEHRLPCSAVAFGYGLRSEAQLADLAGCEFAFDAVDRQWLPRRAVSGRSSRADVYLAGDGAGILGADAAELAGERAAWAVLEDAGLAVDAARVDRLEAGLDRLRRVRQTLEAAFPFPAHLAGALPADLVLCRCEDVPVGAARDVVNQHDAGELNRVKALSRIGMGRCQGRVCGAAVAEVVAAQRDADPAAVGRLRAQAPVKPLVVDLSALRRERGGGHER